MRQHVWTLDRTSSRGGTWRYRCHACGAQCESRGGAWGPTIQDVLDSGVHTNCDVQLVRSVIGS